MANTFYIEPIDGGNTDSWGPKELRQNRNVEGNVSCKLYDDSGTLKLSTGNIGFNNGINRGTVLIDTITTVSLAGVSNGNWAKVELSTSGTTPTIAATDITGATDSNTIPTEFTGAWDGAKQSYYISTTKKCIGLIWKTSGGSLDGVINVLLNTEGYFGTSETSSFAVIKDHNISGGLTATGTAISADTTIGDQTTNKLYWCDSGTDGIKITLPTLADNQNIELTFLQTNSDSSVTMIDGEGAETINGLTHVFLENQGQTLKLKGESSEWKIISGLLIADTGWRNFADQTNRELGSQEVDYDNLSGTFQVGETVTFASGVTGVVMADDGSTLKLHLMTGVGYAVNNESITGNKSSATALVNEPGGNTKEQDTNMYHGLAVSQYKLYKKIIISTDKTDANIVIDSDSLYNADAAPGAPLYFNFGWRGVDTNNTQCQTGADGVTQMNADGTTTTLSASDYYYKIILELKF